MLKKHTKVNVKNEKYIMRKAKTIDSDPSHFKYF